ncbi:MAG TPA: adenylate/guanylate cyclase domain-containing protein [Acidimicrobiia bacterium]|nr:adenylate/guanylate cyclase domain-containing protein [Acidimicrobiia bacterium]
MELTFLFADVRGSTAIAEKISPTAFTAVMNRFFGVANRVLVRSDAYIDKLVGDEVVGFYMPYLGPDNSRRAVETGRELLIATGHQDEDGPWLPVGVGINTGVAFVGSVGTPDGRTDFTAMGDVVNVTARFSSLATAGEIIIGDTAWNRVALANERSEVRLIEVKGKTDPLRVHVLKVAPPGNGH